MKSLIRAMSTTNLVYCVGWVVFSAAPQAALAANWYVDNAVATPGNGQSWASAFKNFSNISWSAITPVTRCT